jgi:hypothetical protein
LITESFSNFLVIFVLQIMSQIPTSAEPTNSKSMAAKPAYKKPSFKVGRKEMQMKTKRL